MKTVRTMPAPKGGHQIGLGTNASNRVLALDSDPNPPPLAQWRSEYYKLIEKPLARLIDDGSRRTGCDRTVALMATEDPHAVEFSKTRHQPARPLKLSHLASACKAGQWEIA